jgi:hypothetical protein
MLVFMCLTGDVLSVNAMCNPFSSMISDSVCIWKKKISARKNPALRVYQIVMLSLATNMIHKYPFVFLQPRSNQGSVIPLRGVSALAERVGYVVGTISSMTIDATHSQR